MARRPVAMQCWPSARGGQGLQQRGSPDPQEQARPSSGSWPRPQGPPAGRQHRHPLRRWTVPTPLSWWPSRHHRNMPRPPGRDAPGHVQPQGESPAPGPSSPYPNPRPDLPDRRQSAAVCHPAARTAQATRARPNPGCRPQGVQAGRCQVAPRARVGACGLIVRPVYSPILTFGLPIVPKWISSDSTPVRCTSQSARYASTTGPYILHRIRDGTIPQMSAVDGTLNSTFPKPYENAFGPAAGDRPSSSPCRSAHLDRHRLPLAICTDCDIISLHGHHNIAGSRSSGRHSRKSLLNAEGRNKGCCDESIFG